MSSPYYKLVFKGICHLLVRSGDIVITILFERGYIIYSVRMEKHIMEKQIIHSRAINFTIESNLTQPMSDLI